MIARPIACAIARPIAWAFFAPFIIITGFVVLNPFILRIVSSMQPVYVRSPGLAGAEAWRAHDQREARSGRIAALAADIRGPRQPLEHSA